MVNLTIAGSLVNVQNVARHTGADIASNCICADLRAAAVDHTLTDFCCAHTFGQCLCIKYASERHT